MSYIQGEGRSQGTLFPVMLDDLIPADHVCRVLDVFVTGRAIFSSCIYTAIFISSVPRVGLRRSAVATWS